MPEETPKPKPGRFPFVYVLIVALFMTASVLYAITARRAPNPIAYWGLATTFMALAAIYVILGREKAAELANKSASSDEERHS